MMLNIYTQMLNSENVIKTNAIILPNLQIGGSYNIIQCVMILDSELVQLT